MSLLLTIAEKFSSLPPEIATMLIAMLPVGELRASIPIGIALYKLSAFSSLLWSIIGNMIPIYFILLAFDPVATWLRKKSRLIDQLLTWLFERTRRKLEKDVAKYGVIALAIFVAIPLPATGAWSGALAAFVFGIEKKKAFLSIFIGVLIAGVIVLALTQGGLLAVDAIK